MAESYTTPKEFPEQTELAETDELMVTDTNAASKRFLISRLWTWIWNKIQQNTLATLNNSSNVPVRSSAVNGALERYERIVYLDEDYASYTNDEFVAHLITTYTVPNGRSVTFIFNNNYGKRVGIKDFLGGSTQYDFICGKCTLTRFANGQFSIIYDINTYYIGSYRYYENILAEYSITTTGQGKWNYYVKNADLNTALSEYDINYSNTVIRDFNLAIPEKGKEKLYLIPANGTQSNKPDSSTVQWYLRASRKPVISGISNEQRVIQQAICFSGASHEIKNYIRTATSTDGTTWEWGAWEKVTTATDLNNALANLPKVIKTQINANKTLTLTHNTDTSNMFIWRVSIQGNIGQGYASYIIQGYGAGTSTRDHIFTHYQGTAITIAQADNVITITNTNNLSGIAKVVIEVLEGEAPTITTN